MEDASGPSSYGTSSSLDGSNSSLADTQSTPGLSPPKRTLSLEELSPSVGSQFGPRRIYFVMVTATPYGPQTTSSTFDFAAFSSVPPHLRRTLLIREEYSSSETSPPEIPEGDRILACRYEGCGTETLSARAL